MKKVLTLVCVVLLSVNGCFLVSSASKASNSRSIIATDVHSFDTIEVTVVITAIRVLNPTGFVSVPNFFMNLSINGEEFTSPMWQNQHYVYPDWSTTIIVPDGQENVSVRIQLWNHYQNGDQLCDIKGGEPGTNDVNLTYTMNTGHWRGDDYRSDPSGYGRLNGCDDGSIYNSQDRDCELWFTIIQTDLDGDGIPPWMETNAYGTDPYVNDSTFDPNDDGIPITWDWKWGYDPYANDNHSMDDPDTDSITNEEEYLTTIFESDPFRKDVFLELDFMEESPDGTTNVIPPESIELLQNPFHRRNIVFHVDIGQMNGGEIIPYDETVTFDEVRELYTDYFLHDVAQHWKRGVFHYGIIVDKCTPGGYGFSGDVSPYTGYLPGTNSFIISSKHLEKNDRFLLTKSLAYVYGSAIMHEMGHNFGMRWGNPYGCDAQRSKYPWQFGYWYYRSYKSIMNYHYTYKIFDYSDGTHGKRDHNDWAAVNLSYFEIPNQLLLYYS